MDIPEMKIVRRGLEENRADAVVVLATLLKTLGDDHLATYGPGDESWEPIEPTLYESLLKMVKSQVDKNGELGFERGPNGEIQERPGAAALAAAKLATAQDALRDILGCGLDYLRVFESEPDAEAA